MAISNVLNPNYKPWTRLYIPANTPTKIQLENNGEYIGIFLGNASQSELFTVLIGSSGNASHTVYGNNTALTITDGSGNGQITLQCNTARYVYIIPLNNVAPATII